MFCLLKALFLVAILILAFYTFLYIYQYFSQQWASSRKQRRWDRYNRQHNDPDYYNPTRNS